MNTALLMALVNLVILLCLFKKKGRKAGDIFWLGAFLYGGSHVLLESLRRDGHMLLGFVHVEQLFALLIALPALLIFAIRCKKIWLALLMTVMLAGAVIGLEFALDRSNIADGILYALYALLTAGYLFLGRVFFRKQQEMMQTEGTIRA